MVANDMKIFLKIKNKGQLGIEKKYKSWKNKPLQNQRLADVSDRQPYARFIVDKYIKQFL